MVVEHEFRLSFPNILEYVKEVGTDNIGAFSGNHEGGYYLQQVPHEITAFITYLIDNGLTSFENYLEIGSAAGGLTRLLSDFIELQNVYIIDNNEHDTHRARRTLLYELNPTEFVGDSHSRLCWRTMCGWDKKFDLVHIDGDHSYEGVMEDTILVSRHLKDGALVMLHDIRGQYCPGVIKWYDELVDGAMPEFEHVKSFVCSRPPMIGIGLFKYHFDPVVH
jgi:predicted O-methyltransferase YrrM